MKAICTTDIHLTDETVITSKPMQSGAMHWEALIIDGDVVTLYVNSREQAERLFDEVSDLTMRWRERDPDQVKVDAVISDPDHIWMGPHDECLIDGPHQHPGVDPDRLRRAREWAAGEGPRVPAVMTDEEVVARYDYHAQKMSES